MRYRIAGKENLYALGTYTTGASYLESDQAAEERRKGGAFTLAEARIELERCRRLVKQGIHPSHDRQARTAATVAEGANTFRAVAGEWIEKNRERWSPYYLRQVERFMKADVYPYIGALPIRAITSARLLDVVKRVEKRAPTVALLVRQWCSAVFRYAVATLRADGDPTVALKGAVTRRRVQHHKPLGRSNIPQFLEAMQKHGGLRPTAIAMHLLLLTFVRPIELRAAQWDEFDLEGALWRIPAERMKMRRPHLVPLSHQAVALLRELQAHTGKQRWLFPNTRRPSTYMTGTTLNRVLERRGYAGQLSSHGFRATASTILNETGFRSDVIERQLAHAPKDKVRASYNQAEYLSERKDMMQAWADLVDADSTKVVPISSGGKRKAKPV